MNLRFADAEGYPLEGLAFTLPLKRAQRLL